MSNQGQLQAWLRGQTGTALDFNGDMLAFLSQEGYTTGTYNERLYLYLKDILALDGGFTLNGLQEQFANAYGFDSWGSVTALSANQNFSFYDGNNFIFYDGNDFVFYS